MMLRSIQITTDILGILRWILVSSLIVILTRICTFDLIKNYKISKVILLTHLYGNTDILNKSKHFATSLKKKIIHIYFFQGLVGEVSKLFVNNAIPYGNKAFKEEQFYMAMKPTGRSGNKMFLCAVVFADARTHHTSIPLIMKAKNLDLVQKIFGTSFSISRKLKHHHQFH